MLARSKPPYATSHDPGKGASPAHYSGSSSVRSGVLSTAGEGRSRPAHGGFGRAGLVRLHPPGPRRPDRRPAQSARCLCPGTSRDALRLRQLGNARRTGGLLLDEEGQGSAVRHHLGADRDGLEAGHGPGGAHSGDRQGWRSCVREHPVAGGRVGGGKEFRRGSRLRDPESIA